ncbi:MAG: hypothetical protein RJQ09_15910 [Cyclobacteriaceae bacterium]
MRSTVIILFLSILSIESFSQRGIDSDSVLNIVKTMQAQEDDFYDDGLFKSQRYWLTTESAVEDNNIFFTASIALVLELIEGETDSIKNEIIKSAKANYPKYANRNGEVTYNFWQTTGEDLPFPNGGVLIRREHYRLPDDFDDTILIQLSKDDSIGNDAVRQKMTDYSNRDSRGEVPGTLKRYRKYDAYEVWFADKLEQEYDIVVMANVMLFILKNGYQLNPTDKETIQLIQQMIFDRTHIRDSPGLSPYYRNTPIILYHLARLLSYDHKGLFSEIKGQIIDDIQSQLKRTKSEMEKVLLYSSLLRLGVQIVPNLNYYKLIGETEAFIFVQFQPHFIIGLPSMKWRCQALNWAFLYELLISCEQEGISPNWVFEK